MYLSALNLSNTEELSLLASVNNEYVTSKLQKAATLHEKSLQAPWRRWSGGGHQPGGGDRGRPTRGAYLTEIPEDGDEDFLEGDAVLPEEEAAELHEAYMAQEAAKTRFREMNRSRGYGAPMARTTARAPLKGCSWRSRAVTAQGANDVDTGIGTRSAHSTVGGLRGPLTLLGRRRTRAPRMPTSCTSPTRLGTGTMRGCMPSQTAPAAALWLERDGCSSISRSRVDMVSVNNFSRAPRISGSGQAGFSTPTTRRRSISRSKARVFGFVLPS